MSEGKMGTEPIIEVHGLTKVYHVGDVEVHALRGVDLEIARGEFVAIVGASGSGKSTLFHILGGLTPASAGTVVIDGKDLAQHLRVAIASSQPEGHTQFAQLCNVDGVPLAVDRLADLGEDRLATRRSVVSAGGARLDHQSVDATIGLLEHGGCQRVGADDGQELGPSERAKLDFHELSRVEVHGNVVTLLRAMDMDRIFRRLVVDVAVQHAGNFQRNSRAHDDVSNACQHRAIDA
jgi:energy-coupling factor transporter ATP-binding protein EcfA2